MTNEEIFAATAIKNWTVVTGRLDKMLSGFTEEEMQLEVAHGRNRVYYVVGHLAAVNDRLLPMLGLGERLHPELDEVFLSKPDRASPDTFTGVELREALAEIDAKITTAVAAMPAAHLLQRHSDVSEEDFAKEPLRNRLAVFESRTAHAMYHMGQIRLAK